MNNRPSSLTATWSHEKIPKELSELGLVINMTIVCFNTYKNRESTVHTDFAIQESWMLNSGGVLVRQFPGEWNLKDRKVSFPRIILNY